MQVELDFQQTRFKTIENQLNNEKCWRSIFAPEIKQAQNVIGGVRHVSEYSNLKRFMINWL